MSDFRIRCSSLGKIMTEPRTKAECTLSVGARTYIRSLVAEDIYGVTFEFSSKETEKGIEVEDESIAMLNRVRGLSLTKNTERKTNEWITGEADLFDAERRRGHDIKSSWSLKTFPISVADCEDKLYELQMRGYMMLWDADEWSVDYCMVETPERLIGYDPLQLHLVSHIPEHMRITSWTVRRDAAIEERIIEKVKAAREYYHQAVDEFDRTHRAGNPLEAAAVMAPAERPIVVPSVALTSPLAALLSA